MPAPPDPDKPYLHAPNANAAPIHGPKVQIPANAMAKRITPQNDDYSQWYLDVVREARLADHSPVRGCMVVRPNGYAIWENMRERLDAMFKETGHQNAYFPLFIPKSFLSKEAQHVEGFAKECAVVTHSRLQAVDGGVQVDPDSRLEEELIVRPTSETIIWDAYRGWIQSYRDLPILINQWANVVRWEMRTRLFLRTMEFLWQEGHTAHATQEEAVEETLRMLEVYRTFAEQTMAMPVLTGVKTASERFAGAVDTYCIEALMQDGKALQAGTSHFLGQNFAKAFDVKYQTREGSHDHVWATSWGVSTRLIGGLIMTHSDDSGLVVPPRLAPNQVALVPIFRSQEELAGLMESVDPIAAALRKAGVRVYVDTRDQYKPGFKYAEHEAQGVPLRIAIGKRDLENGQAEIARRDTLQKSFEPLGDLDGFASRIASQLDTIQSELLSAAKRRMQSRTRPVDTYGEFKEQIEQGGFLLAHWDGTAETEARIKEETKATIRCVPIDGDLGEEMNALLGLGGGAPETGRCMVTGRPSPQRVVLARAY